MPLAGLGRKAADCRSELSIVIADKISIFVLQMPMFNFYNKSEL